MKSKTKLSVYCSIITTMVIIAFLVGIVSSQEDGHKYFLLIAIFICLIGFSLFYFPINAEATNTSLIIRRVLKSKTISYSDISSVDRCFPSAGGLRLCGSGGFMGYWGYFSDIIIGTYFGYYGNRNECILIKLKGGQQYVISCMEPDKMTSFINGKL